MPKLFKEHDIYEHIVGDLRILSIMHVGYSVQGVSFQLKEFERTSDTMRNDRRIHHKDLDGSINSVPIIDMQATGINISHLRENVGISVHDLQKVLGLASPQAIYRWQRGETVPSVDHLLILAHIFGVTMDDIIVIKHIDI